MRIALVLFALITVCLILLFIMQIEGFANPKRSAYAKDLINGNPDFDALTDEQVVELMIIIISAWASLVLVDPTMDPDAQATAKEMGSMMPQGKIVWTPQEIKSLRNRLKNTASKNVNISTAFNILLSKIPEMSALYKKFHGMKANNTAAAESFSKEKFNSFSKSVVKDVKRKIPKFPFNPEIKKNMPQAFED
jgi:hypothetical protein